MKFKDIIFILILGFLVSFGWFTHFMWLFLRLLRSAVVPAILRRMWRNRRRILAAVRR